MKWSYLVSALFLSVASLASTNVVMAKDGTPELRDEPCTTKKPIQTWKNLKKDAVTGVIQDVQIEESCMGDRDVLQLKVMSNDGEVLVNVAPTVFVTHKKFNFAIGDKVAVTGVVYVVDGQKTMVAGQLKKGEETLVLRDGNGNPAWARTTARGTTHTPHISRH